MVTAYNIYCDESCHLEHDGQGVMVLGAVWCPLEKAAGINRRIREIKKRHRMDRTFEAKWVKVSPSKRQMYLDMVDYFFDDDDLHFRGLIVPDKGLLDHRGFAQSHDDWYYKLLFQLLKVILSPDARHFIYLDIKDTRSAAKEARLREVLCNNFYDFSRQIVGRVQGVRSHEIEILQIADILIGAVGYANRSSSASPAKKALVERIQRRSQYSLTRTTLYREEKVNLLLWQASEELRP